MTPRPCRSTTMLDELHHVRGHDPVLSPNRRNLTFKCSATTLLEGRVSLAGRGGRSAFRLMAERGFLYRRARDTSERILRRCGGRPNEPMRACASGFRASQPTAAVCRLVRRPDRARTSEDEQDFPLEPAPAVNRLPFLAVKSMVQVYTKVLSECCYLSVAIFFGHKDAVKPLFHA